MPYLLPVYRKEGVATWDCLFHVLSLSGIGSQTTTDDILEEALKLRNFNHENVLNLIGICIEGGHSPCLLTPFMANGSLLSYLRKEKKSLVVPKEADEDTVSFHPLKSTWHWTTIKMVLLRSRTSPWSWLACASRLPMGWSTWLRRSLCTET